MIRFRIKAAFNNIIHGFNLPELAEHFHHNQQLKKRNNKRKHQIASRVILLLHFQKMRPERFHNLYLHFSMFFFFFFYLNMLQIQETKQHLAELTPPPWLCSRQHKLSTSARTAGWLFSKCKYQFFQSLSPACFTTEGSHSVITAA